MSDGGSSPALEQSSIRHLVEMVVWTGGAYLGYHILQHYLGEYLPFEFDDLLVPGINYFEAVRSVWFVFIFGPAAALLYHLYQVIRRRRRQYDPIYVLVKGVKVSAIAGFFEELIFRAFMFLTTIIFIQVVNESIIGGVAAFYNTIALPLANWLTLGYLEPQLLDQTNWFIGAAAVMTNAKFRDGHLYQGLIGWVHAWFFGMAMYYLLFNYGLQAAILVHFLYNMSVFGATALGMKLQPS